MTIDNRHDIWVEKYRPQKIGDLILPEKYLNKFKEFLKKPSNILLSSINPGTGKTSSVNAIIKEGEFESIFINASLENGIDTLRGKIQHFASTESFDGKPKIVVLDECLEENERIIIKQNNKEVPIKLNKMKKGIIYNCISFNMDTQEIEDDTCEIVSDKIDDIYEVELEDGRKIKVTSNHPFIVKNNDKIEEITIDSGLKVGDNVICREEISIPLYNNEGVQNYLRKYNLKTTEEAYLKLNKIESKPKSEKDNSINIIKSQYAIDYCKKQNFKYEVIDDDWFKINFSKNNLNVLEQDLKEYVLNLLKVFWR